MTGSDDTVQEVLWKALEEAWTLIDIEIMKELIGGHGKEDKSSHSCGRMVYKILKIDYGAENVANYVCNHSTKFESFLAIMSWLVLD